MTDDLVADYDLKIEFLIEAATALHQNGVSSERLLKAIHDLGEKWGVEVDTFVTPTFLTMYFGKAANHLNVFKSISSGDSKLWQIRDLDQLGDQVLSDELTVQEALQALRHILQKKSPYVFWHQALAFGAVSFSVAVLFQASFLEIGISSMMGVLIALLARVSQSFNGFNRMFEFVAAFFTASLLNLLFWIYPHFSVQLITITTLIIIFPGLTLTIAMSELTAHHLVCGTARLMGGLIGLFKLALGIAIATVVTSSISTLPVYEAVPHDHSLGLLAVAFLIVPIAFTVLFDAYLKDAPWIYLVVFMAQLSTHGVAQMTSAIYAPAFMGALVVGLFGSAYARFMKHPAATVLLPGLILLVPGSLGFRGIGSLFEKDTLAGLDTFIEAVIIALSIAGGLLLANTILPPKRNL